MRRPSPRLLWTSAVVVVLAVVVGVGLSAGRSGPPRPADTSGPAVPVVLPGRPGDSPSTVSSDELEAPDGTAYNQLDVAFMRMMIAHHTQALEMALLAPDRAGRPQVRALADRIRATQLPEIGAMRGWLAQRGLAEADPGHDHAGMPGMQGPEKIRQLADAHGAAFDALFVDMMAAHHEGAITMARDVLRVARSGQVEELATAIATEQRIEIDRMRDALRT